MEYYSPVKNDIGEEQLLTRKDVLDVDWVRQAIEENIQYNSILVCLLSSHTGRCIYMHTDTHTFLKEDYTKMSIMDISLLWDWELLLCYYSCISILYIYKVMASLALKDHTWIQSKGPHRERVSDSKQNELFYFIFFLLACEWLSCSSVFHYYLCGTLFISKESNDWNVEGIRAF